MLERLRGIQTVNGFKFRVCPFQPSVGTVKSEDIFSSQTYCNP